MLVIKNENQNNFSKNTDKHDALFATALTLFSKRNYSSAGATLTDLDQTISQTREEILASVRVPENLLMENTPPASGYRRQKVQVAAGLFMVDIITADLNSTRVIVDTAADGDCSNDCPVLSLADYVGRNSAFAGINGSYFCPASYPSCADRKNSFNTLLMNKDKKYFNSDNNVYSIVPAAIFFGNGSRFVGQSLEWGRDTGVDAVIANQPLLVIDGQNLFGGDSDQKKSVKSGRSFLGSTNNNVYLGVVHNASVAESAQVVHTLGIKNALNLDSGGSTALWYSGYKAGPGRNIPNAVLLVRK